MDDLLYKKTFVRFVITLMKHLLAISFYVCVFSVAAFERMNVGVLQISPYIEVNDSDADVQGFVPHLVKEIMAPLDIEVRFKTLAIPRLRRALENGEIDAFPLMLNTGNTASSVVLTATYFSSKDYVWAVNKKHPNGIQWHSMDDLKSYSIGVLKGASYGPQVDAFIEANSSGLYFSDEVEMNLKMLVSGRLDGIFSNEDIIRSFRKSLGSNVQIVPSQKPIYINYYSIGISKKSPFVDRVNEMNVQIRELTNSSRIDDIRQQYLTKPVN